jgi:excisionase family DNA binding protein
VDTKRTQPKGAPIEDVTTDKAWLERVIREAREHSQMLRVKDVAARLGVSTAAVYGWIEQGDLAHARLFSNAIRVSEAELLAFVRQRTGRL